MTRSFPTRCTSDLPLLRGTPLVLSLLACLISYSGDDPSWSRAGSISGALHNFGGIAGAWVADLVFYLSGYMAYLRPVVLGWVVWLATHGRAADEEHLAPALRLSGIDRKSTSLNSSH